MGQHRWGRSISAPHPRVGLSVAQRHLQLGLFRLDDVGVVEAQGVGFLVCPQPHGPLPILQPTMHLSRHKRYEFYRYLRRVARGSKDSGIFNFRLEVNDFSFRFIVSKIGCTTVLFIYYFFYNLRNYF